MGFQHFSHTVILRRWARINGRQVCAIPYPVTSHKFFFITKESFWISLLFFINVKPEVYIACTSSVCIVILEHEIVVILRTKKRRELFVIIAIAIVRKWDRVQHFNIISINVHKWILFPLVVYFKCHCNIAIAWINGKHIVESFVAISSQSFPFWDVVKCIYMQSPLL